MHRCRRYPSNCAPRDLPSARRCGSRPSSLDPCECGRVPRVPLAALSAGECGFAVGQYSELSEDNRPFRITIETLDLAVFQFEHVATRATICFLVAGTRRSRALHA